MAFKKGKLVFNQAGALPPAALEELIAAGQGLRHRRRDRRQSNADRSLTDGTR